MKRKPFSLLLLIGLATLLFAFVGCSDDDDGGTGPATPIDQFEVVRSAADTWLAGPTPISTSIDLNTLRTDGNAANDPFVLSVRSAAHFALGHIPGAINIPWRDVAKPASLALLPASGPIVAYCYTGHTGQIATTVLGVLGHDVTNMKFGIMAWTKDATVRATAPFTPPIDVYPIELTANTPSTTYPLPTLDVTTSRDTAEILRAAADAYLSSGTSPSLGASDVAGSLANYFIVSVRSAAHYAQGHVPGAINIPWKDIAKPENLAKLPTDQTILVYCYTGHTGQIASTVLSLLGYDAVNLRHGMAGWTTNPTYMGGVVPFVEGDWPDLPTEP